METQRQSQSSWQFSLRLNTLLPKINEDSSDCQDSTGVNLENGRFCLSDGATQSFFPKLWSQELCNSYCKTVSVVNHSNWLDWLSVAQHRWHDLVLDRCSSLQIQKKISWIECSNGLSLKRPAYATFLGFSIEEGFIKGVSIGDSYAFLLRIYPEVSSTSQRSRVVLERIIPGLWNPDFSNRTEGLCSYADTYDSKPEFFEIPIKLTDDSQLVILIMSDALACYALAAENRGKSILPMLAEITSSNQFEDLVTHLRSNGLANDDTSLLSVQVEPALYETVTNNDQDCVAHTSLDVSAGPKLFLPSSPIHSPDQSPVSADESAQVHLRPESDDHSIADPMLLTSAKPLPYVPLLSRSNSPLNWEMQNDEQLSSSPNLPDFLQRGKVSQHENPLISQFKKMLRIPDRRMRD